MTSSNLFGRTPSAPGWRFEVAICNLTQKRNYVLHLKPSLPECHLRTSRASVNNLSALQAPRRGIGKRSRRFVLHRNNASFGRITANKGRSGT
jgi:hypothetical protein